MHAKTASNELLMFIVHKQVTKTFLKFLKENMHKEESAFAWNAYNIKSHL